MKLAVFDVDGTLVNSQHQIHAAMAAAAAAVDLPAPTIEQVRSVVGLSLPLAIDTICPGLSDARLASAMAAYRTRYHALGLGMPPPMFDGARQCVERLAGQPGLLLGIATGKGRRGLDQMLAGYGLDHFFAATECADRNPSKPDPAMLKALCATLDVAPAQTLMIGDTSFDMEMARAGGAIPIGVAWGYHAPEGLRAAGATWVAPDFPALADYVAAWAA